MTSLLHTYSGNHSCPEKMDLFDLIVLKGDEILRASLHKNSKNRFWVPSANAKSHIKQALADLSLVRNTLVIIFLQTGQ